MSDRPASITDQEAGARDAVSDVPGRDRVTGPAALDAPAPQRQGTYSVAELLALDEALDEDTPDDNKVKRELGEVVRLMSKSATGRTLMQNLQDNDIRLGGLKRGDTLGYYLARDRALYVVSDNPAEALNLMAHEARHALQTVNGWSTLIEYHAKGTKLPHDARSYLRLNRVLEADADATKLAVVWEAAQEDPLLTLSWDMLKRDVHFGRMATAFEDAVAVSRRNDPATGPKEQVRAGMAAAFETWITVGTPLRAEGYDTYLMGWLEKTADKNGPIQADRPFTMADAKEITALGRETPYWRAEDGAVAAFRFNRFAAEIEDRLQKIEDRLLPAPDALETKATAGLSKWRRARAPARLAPAPAPAPTP